MDMEYSSPSMKAFTKTEDEGPKQDWQCCEGAAALSNTDSRVSATQMEIKASPEPNGPSSSSEVSREHTEAPSNLESPPLAASSNQRSNLPQWIFFLRI